MFKKYTGLFLILAPVLIGILLFKFNLEYFWYYSKHYKVYDLLYSTINLIIFIIGVSLLFTTSKASLAILFATVFIAYQVLAWTFTIPRYSALLTIAPNAQLTLVPYDAGAFSSHNYSNIEISTSFGLLFIKTKRLKTFDNIASGQLWFKNNKTIGITLQTYSKEIVNDEIPLNDIIQ